MFYAHTPALLNPPNPRKILTGDALIEKMKQIEDKEFDVFWLDDNEGNVLKAIVYQNGRYVCEVQEMPKFQRAKAEQTEQDLINKALQDAYTMTVIRFAEKQSKAIESIGIVSADGRLGCGTIYKAANFKYYGHHKTTFVKNKRTGEISHEMNFTRMDSKGMYLRNNLAFLLGDVEVFQVDTYRYIFPLCKRFRYNKPSQPYPAYNRGVTPFEWQRNRKLIKERLIKFISELE